MGYIGRGGGIGPIRKQKLSLIFTKSQFKYLRPHGAPKFHAGVFVKGNSCRQDFKIGLLTSTFCNLCLLPRQFIN